MFEYPQNLYTKKNTKVKMKLIDIRSDTVTQPTKEMLDAIVQAELGDDGRRQENPTVNKLEKISRVYNFEIKYRQIKYMLI